VRGVASAKQVQADLCLPCVNFMEPNLNTLIKVISGVGAYGTCQLLCNMLNESTAVVETCVGLCSLVGYPTFWQLFERANLDPFWACQLLNTCPVVVNPAATIATVVVDPPQGVAGTVFQFILSFTVTNDTGVGEIAYVVYFASGLQKYVNVSIFEDYEAGAYKVALASFPTYNNSTYAPGNYPIIVSVCAGLCGGRSPNAEILSEVESSFEIVASTS